MKMQTPFIPEQNISQQLNLLTKKIEEANKNSNKDAEIPLEFNPFTLFNLHEMSVSKILAFLLNPKASHAQGTLYLDAFINLIKRTSLFSKTQEKLKKVPEALTNTFVYTEQSIKDFGRLDLLLRNKEGIIVIENKFGAYDGNEQLERYAQWLSKQNVPALVLVYLNERAPSKTTFGNNFTGQDFTVHITYSEMIQALDEANDKVTQSGVRIFCKLFLNYLQGENMLNQELYNSITESYESINLALQIENRMPTIRVKLWKHFINTLQTAVQEEFKDITIVYDEDPAKCFTSFEVNITDQLTIRFEFQDTNLNDLWWGICRYTDSFDISDEDQKKLSSFMKDIFKCEYSNEWWIWGQYADDFILYRNWNTPEVLFQMAQGNDTNLIKGIIDLIKLISNKQKENPTATQVTWIEK